MFDVKMIPGSAMLLMMNSGGALKIVVKERIERAGTEPQR